MPTLESYESAQIMLSNPVASPGLVAKCVTSTAACEAAIGATTGATTGVSLSGVGFAMTTGVRGAGVEGELGGVTGVEAVAGLAPEGEPDAPVGALVGALEVGAAAATAAFKA